MNQITDKVKDIVEVYSTPILSDFAADPAQTVAGYHFTDITAELMAKWIDRVVTLPANNSSAFALAGYRGVGKSHFLAVFGAILSLPELRSRLKDSHVYSSAERLIRRHYPVIHVRRGTKAKLCDELRFAVSQHFNVDLREIGESPTEIVELAIEKAGAGPTIFIIDTAIEREIRVSRDDGEYLAGIAEAAAGKNVFVAVALDDDVAAADGRNSAIARSFVIDYLDHEHLYKIVDVHIFPKVAVKRRAIYEIFENFRKLLPGFRWSEQRFSSVYPLHPVILEVAPFVRLFVQDFALLAFTSDAGAKILGRPADSLIALDELFDRVEKSLRRSTDLKEAFSAYDELSETVIGKIPVMERLKAKLVLKGLMMLSLDGEGATASDIAASMLIFDEREPNSAVEFVENLLAKLADALPNGLWRLNREDRAAKYGFRLSGKEDFNSALTEAVRAVPETVVPGILMRLMRERFADCDFVDAGGGRQIVETELVWRGSLRRGRVVWCIGEEASLGDDLQAAPLEWEAVLSFGEHKPQGRIADPSCHWRPDQLKQEESETIRRYHALMSRSDLQETFRDQIRTAIQAQTIAIEKVLDRKFLQYGKLIVDGEELEFGPQACSGHTLSEVFSIMLAPYFDRKFASHPEFSAPLEMSAVDELAAGFFAGGTVGQNDQRLVDSFVVPLGLAESSAGSVQFAGEDVLQKLAPVSALVRALNDGGGSIPMSSVEESLGASPFGFTLEAQRLILAGLVGRSLVEFVTTKGDRIGRRSLDLRIIWEDIAGIAFPAKEGLSDAGLSTWASLLTGNEKLRAGPGFDREAVAAALSRWLEDWTTRSVLEKFAAMPDCTVSTRVWQLGTQVQRSFGAAADAVRAMTGGDIDVESGLIRIRDAFSASEDEFKARNAELVELEAALDVIPIRQRIAAEIDEYEITDDSRAESLRSSIRMQLASPEIDLRSVKELEELMKEFRIVFAEHYTACHDALARSHEIREKMDEIFRSDRWWVFENLSSIPTLSQRYRNESRRILRELRSMNCSSASGRQGDAAPPYCVCGFTLARAKRFADLPSQLSAVIDDGLSAYAREVGDKRSMISDVSGGNDIGTELSALLDGKTALSSMSDPQVRMLRYLLMPSRPANSDHEFMTEAPADAVVVAEEFANDAVILNV